MQSVAVSIKGVWHSLREAERQSSLTESEKYQRNGNLANLLALLGVLKGFISSQTADKPRGNQKGFKKVGNCCSIDYCECCLI